MTDKELRHLGKGELIEIIYQQKKEEESLRRELQLMKKKLSSRELKKENAGSLAEAALAVNGVLEAAQRAAEDYLAQIHTDHAGVEEYCLRRTRETEEKCRELMSETEQRCRQLSGETEQQCLQREQLAERFVREQWDSFRQRTEDYISARQELAGLLGPKSPKA